jgi:uncharacterized protein YlzI (FlbEa/FlbD family)
MIWITRIDGDRVLLNDDQILYVEVNHDTLLVLASGERVRVLETAEELIDRIARWRQRSLGLSFFHDDEAAAG